MDNNDNMASRDTSVASRYESASSSPTRQSGWSQAGPQASGWLPRTSLGTTGGFGLNASRYAPGASPAPQFIQPTWGQYNQPPYQQDKQATAPAFQPFDASNTSRAMAQTSQSTPPNGTTVPIYNPFDAAVRQQGPGNSYVAPHGATGTTAPFNSPARSAASPPPASQQNLSGNAGQRQGMPARPVAPGLIAFNERQASQLLGNLRQPVQQQQHRLGSTQSVSLTSSTQHYLFV